MTIKQRLEILEKKIKNLEVISHPPRDFVKRIELDKFKRDMSQMNRILLKNAQSSGENYNVSTPN